jgi:NAD(P)-dependent dehydrogenase (short-subunit alcohol dehydrogenase family)
MARVALVTGGTRGIGAAISKGLKDAGYKVAANYGGNDEAPNTFKTETGIPVFKFDVSDAASCESGIKAVEAELGPVDILVNNAGITRNGMFHKMTYDQWSDGPGELFRREGWRDWLRQGLGAGESRMCLIPPVFSRMVRLSSSRPERPSVPLPLS